MAPRVLEGSFHEIPPPLSPGLLRVSSIARVGLLHEGLGSRREFGAYPQRSVTGKPRSPGTFWKRTRGSGLFSRPMSWLAPHRPLQVCPSLAPRWTRESLAAKHRPFVGHDTRSSGLVRSSALPRLYFTDPSARPVTRNRVPGAVPEPAGRIQSRWLHEDEGTRLTVDHVHGPQVFLDPREGSSSVYGSGLGRGWIAQILA